MPIRPIDNPKAKYLTVEENTLEELTNDMNQLFDNGYILHSRNIQLVQAEITGEPTKYVVIMKLPDDFS